MMQLNEDEVVKLADVCLTKPERDISGTICGSTCYSAPEVKSSPEQHHTNKLNPVIRISLSGSIS